MGSIHWPSMASEPRFSNGFDPDEVPQPPEFAQQNCQAEGSQDQAVSHAQQHQPTWDQLRRDHLRPSVFRHFAPVISRKSTPFLVKYVSPRHVQVVPEQGLSAA